MKNIKKKILICLLLFSTIFFAQEQILYKQVDTTRLYLELHKPENSNELQEYPALIFFFGGGWVGGDKHQFLKHAEYFSKMGILCFLADYRIKNRNKTTPYEALKDAKSAIRFLRKNALRYKIDTTKIITVGGSAGGNLAAATALIMNHNDIADDTTISCVPNALVLFNPVIDNGPKGYGYERIGEDYINFSPIHNIKNGAPPTLFLLGTKDNLVPVKTARKYKKMMEKVGGRCDLKLYKGAKHGFFNYRYRDNFNKTIKEMHLFLESLGYISG